MRITFKRIQSQGQEVLLPRIDGKELPARSVTIKQGYPDEPFSKLVTRAVIEVNLPEGIIIDE